MTATSVCAVADRLVWTPRPEQGALLSFAGERERRAWWATMGSGKTAAAIEHLRRAHEDSFSLDTALVVAPNLVAKHTWPKEFAKWAHGAPIGPVRVLTHADFGFKRTCDVLDGPGRLAMSDWREVRKRLLGYRERVHIIQWDWFWWLVKALNRSSHYSHVIYDEATFASDHESQRWKAARYLTKELGCGDVLEMTGGPAPNGYEKLWAQMFLLDGGMRLGRTLTEFRYSWMVPDKMDGSTGRVFKWKVNPARKGELDKLLSELAISVVVDLGVESKVIDHRLPLPDDAQAIYDEVERDFIHHFSPDSHVLVGSKAVMVGKLLQIAQGAVYDQDRMVQHVHDVKLDRLEEIIDSSPRGVLLAYAYQHDFERLKKRFKFAKHIKDAGNIQRFANGSIKLLCMHPASGAHGVDELQYGGHTCVWFGVPYNWEHYSQFNARLVRGGQKETVFIHRILMEGTIEEDVADVSLAEKCDEETALLRACQWRYRE